MSQKNKKDNQHYFASIYGSISSKNDGVLDFIRNAILYDLFVGSNCFIRHPSFRIPLLCGVDAKHMNEIRQKCTDADLSSCFFKMSGLVVLENSVEGDILWLEMEDCGVTALQRDFYSSPIFCRTHPHRKVPLKGAHPVKVVTRIPICAGGLRRINVEAIWERLQKRFKEYFKNDLDEETFFLNNLEYEERRGNQTTIVSIPLKN